MSAKKSEKDVRAETDIMEGRTMIVGRCSNELEDWRFAM